LITALEDSKLTQQDIYLLYIDFTNAFGSITRRITCWDEHKFNVKIRYVKQMDLIWKCLEGFAEKNVNNMTLMGIGLNLYHVWLNVVTLGVYFPMWN
jgi:hypothetical protein